jgi:hypothetical protein
MYEMPMKHDAKMFNYRRVFSGDLGNDKHLKSKMTGEIIQNLMSVVTAFKLVPMQDSSSLTT